MTLSLVHGRATTRGKRAARTCTEHTGTYGVLIVRALAVDATAARRAATENDFIAGLYDEGFDEWEGGTNPA